MTTYYTDFTRHCMRFFTRHNYPKDGGKNSIAQWTTAKRIFDNNIDKYKEMFMFLYSTKKPFVENIQVYAKNNNVRIEQVWSKINFLEKELALALGLID